MSLNNEIRQIVKHFKDEHIIINDLGVFSEHVITLFEKDFSKGRDGLIQELAGKGSQKIVYAPNYGVSKDERAN